MATDALDDVWLDRYARTLGFGRLADRLPWDVPPSYLYAILLIVVVDPLAAAWAYVNGYPVVYLDNPYFVLQPLALVTAVYGSRSLLAAYDDVMAEMNVENRASDPDHLQGVVPNWLPWTIFLLGAGVMLARAFVVGFDEIHATGGLSAVLGNFVINPFVWAPIAAQFLAVYVAIEFLAPRRLVHSDVGIHFLDPEGLGGLRPIGELIKHAYYYMMAGLVAYALILYTPLVETAAGETTAFTNVTFTAIWLATIVTIAFAVFTLHRFMHREKRAELRRLDERARDLVENPWDVKNYNVPEDRATEVEEIRRRMELVSSTNEYPATFSIWSQLLLAVVIPKAFQLLLANV